MNSENSKTSAPHRLSLNLTNKIDLRQKDKYIALSNLSIQYTQKHIKNSYKNNNFKISAPSWSGEYELHDGSYSISDVQDYFEYILNKHGLKTVNRSIKIYLNEIETRITFNIKTRYYRELLTPETMKLLGNIKNEIAKNKNGENVPHLEITEVVLIHGNFINNSYQQNSRVLYTFVPNKLLDQL